MSRWVTADLALVSLTMTCAVALGGDNISPSPGVRLKIKLAPGAELTCDFTSEIKQTMTESVGGEVAHEIRMDGHIAQIVADAGEDGTLLIGWLGKSRWVAPAGETRTNDTVREQIWLSAYRVDRQGRSLPRTATASGPAQHALRRVVDIIGENAQLCAPFPDHDVTVGTSWKGGVLLPTPGARQPGTAVSTVTALTNEGARQVCIIRSDVTSKGAQSLTTWKPDMTRPDIAVEGFTEGRFDVDRGVWLDMKVHLASSFEGRTGDRGYSGAMVLTSKTVLQGIRQMAADEMAQKAARVKLLDQAMMRLYLGDFSSVLADLNAQQDREEDSLWKDGWKMAVELIKHAEAEGKKLASEDRKTKTASAGDAGTNGVAAVSGALATLQNANNMVRGGKLEEAVTGYRRFLDEAPADIEPGLLVLARYRMAVAQETLGDRKAAQASFAAVAAVVATDDYSVKLKARAEQKALELKEAAQ